MLPSAGRLQNLVDRRVSLENCKLYILFLFCVCKFIYWNSKSITSYINYRIKYCLYISNVTQKAKVNELSCSIGQYDNL